MFLFRQSEFDSDSPESEDEIEDLEEDDKEAIAQGKEIQQRALDKENNENKHDTL